MHKLVEAVNDYYAFSLLAYAAVLYVASHHHVFFWILGFATPILAGWTGYLLKSYLDSRNQRRGFRIVSDSMTYEIHPKNRYTFRYNTKIRAEWNHLMVYPIGYQWTGEGVEGTPKVTGKGQHLLSTVKQGAKAAIKISPYQSTGLTTEGDWHYWFIALNPPLFKGDTARIKYSQEFFDKKGRARPHLGYFVRVPMQELVLNIKFDPKNMPKKVMSTIIKPSDPNHPYTTPGVKFDREKQWATWTIQNPKKGHCYNIHWE